MLGIDTNLLKYALDDRSPFHREAAAFLNGLRDNRDVCLAELVLVELYVLLRNRVVFDPPHSAEEATDLVQSLRRRSRWQIVECAPVMDEVWRVMARPGIARRHIFDVRLGLTLRHHGVTEFATVNVKDFEGLGFERVWNPLVETGD